MICTDNKRLHSCFLFKVNSRISCSCLAWDISSYHAGVSPQKCQWHDSESEETDWLIWKQKIQLWQMCVCMHTLFLTLHSLCFYQYTYKSVVCPLLGEVFWMCLKPHQTYKQCSTNKCHWKTMTGKKPQAVPLHFPVFSLYCLPWKAYSQGSVRDPIVSKWQRQGCSGNLKSKFPEFR